MLPAVTRTNKRIFFLSLFLWATATSQLKAQNTIIRGFADTYAAYKNNKASFGFDEQDLFITSEITDRLSFLGESVFKYSPNGTDMGDVDSIGRNDHSEASEFAVSIERLILKYNIYGNNNILIGKHHTPINYWNDTYHHGRVFFPTIERPLLFAAEIIPLHTTGISFEGHDLGKIKFGYNLMIGNGIGSSAIDDNDKHKSVTAVAYIKPVDDLRIGVSYYHDIISKGANVHGKIMPLKVTQQLATGSFAYFGKKFELLTETTAGFDHNDTTGVKNNFSTFASYLYAGYKIKESIIPYVRVDKLSYQTGEMYYSKNNTTAALIGLRYQFNYLAVIKLEYQHLESELNGSANRLVMQIAVGF